MSTSSDHCQRRCATVILGGVLVLLVLLAVRTVQINTIMRSDLLRAAAHQRRGLLRDPARRGTIADRCGRELAISRLLPDVFLDPTASRNIASTANVTASRLNVSAESILTRVRSHPFSRFILLARRVDAVTAAAIRALKDPAVGLKYRSRRSYPLGSSMSHVLGFVGNDGAGLEGIELAWDDHLRPKDGALTILRDARRRALGISEEDSYAALDGGHVQLTLDAEIQRIAEGALRDAVHRFHSDSGVAIVMRPEDGAVLAMALAPSFDANEAARVPPQIRRNRAVTDPTEPGSAFKPFIVAGALAGGFVSMTEEFDCHNGVFQFGARTVRDTHPAGRLDVLGIITRSSNIGMGLIAERMGNGALHAAIRSFGFGSATGVELPGEHDGVLHPLRRWTRMSATSLAMGYEIGVTPIQLISAFAAIANDGVYVRPRIVLRLRRADGEIVKEFPCERRRVVSAELARYIREVLLVSVVEHGGGKPARLSHTQVFGKTGTAKLPYADRPGYEPGAYVATFLGGAPATNPKVVALVMVRRPDVALGYYGRQVAAPAVGAILNRTLAYLGAAWGNRYAMVVGAGTGRSE